MEYLTGTAALNIPCSLDTCGDWHRSSLDWDKVATVRSENSIYGDWGIEKNIYIPELNAKANVANTIRACIDLINLGCFLQAGGMNKDFICNEKYNDLVFEKILMLKKTKTEEEWEKIDRFMRKEYLMPWVRYSRQKGVINGKNRRAKR